MPGGRGSKRERLVGGARQTLHQQGVEGTTIADIAQASDVPAGNVYYYFKTKDELVRPRSTLMPGGAGSRLPRGAPHPEGAPQGLPAEVAGKGELAARYGCPQGTLCSELDKRDDPLVHDAARLMESRSIGLSSNFGRWADAMPATSRSH